MQHDVQHDKSITYHQYFFSSIFDILFHIHYFPIQFLMHSFVAATVVSHTEQEFMEMQESERYGAWHPRYRVPKPVFGFSKPFAHRHAPSLK